MKKKLLVFYLASVLVMVTASTVVAFSDLPEKKQTVLGLYVTAKQAYTKWHINPGKIHILDVRTPEEYFFVGHPPMAANIPVKFLKAVWNPETKKTAMVTNLDFVSEVKQRYATSDTLFVMCRSGARSAFAVNLLAQAGFQNAYSVVDGFEGEAVKDPESYFEGKRLINGWKNSGAPWTYGLDPKLVYVR
jgi:rhodanese-related sulfurtransferase